MASCLEQPVLLCLALLTSGVMAEESLTGVIAAGVSAGGLLLILFIIITVYCLIKQSRKAKREKKKLKTSANGTSRQNGRIVPHPYPYHTNPLFHTQGPPIRNRPPMMFYTMRHGMRDLSAPSLMEPLPPYMFQPPMLPGYPRPIVVVDDGTISKRSKDYLPNGGTSGVIIREMENGETRESDTENRHRRRYEPKRDNGKSRTKDHGLSKSHRQRSHSHESQRRRSKSRERSSSEEKINRGSQTSNNVMAAPGDIIFAPADTEMTIKRQSTKQESNHVVTNNHVTSDLSLMSTGFDADNNERSAFTIYSPKVEEPEPVAMSDYSPNPVPTSSLNFEYPSKASVKGKSSFTGEENTLSFETDRDGRESSEYPIEPPSDDYRLNAKDMSDYSKTTSENYLFNTQGSSEFHNETNEEDYMFRSHHDSELKASTSSEGYLFKSHRSSEFPVEAPSDDYTEASSRLTTDLPVVTPKEDYQSPMDEQASVDYAFRFNNLEYEKQLKLDKENQDHGYEDAVSFRPPTPPFDAEASTSSLNTIPPPPPLPPSPPLTGGAFAKVKFRPPTPPPGIVRSISDGSPLSMTSTEEERQKILGSNQSPSKNAVIEELKRRRQRTSDDDESESSSPAAVPRAPWINEDNPTPLDSITSSQPRAVQFKEDPPEIIPRDEIDSPTSEAESFSLSATPPPPPPLPPPIESFPNHTKL